MNRVEAVPVIIAGREGYDIQINDREATVQDYIEAVERFISENSCYRARKPELDSCYGCDSCCQERIPVTLIDAFVHGQLTMNQTIENVKHVLVEERVVDITMGVDEKWRCRNLDSEKGICTNYARRPLVCRTYICCPATIRARRLREEIVNSGEDELVRLWFNLRRQDGSLIIHEGLSPDPREDDYPVTPFAGATSYDQVKLKDVCSSKLWHSLTEHEE